MGDGERRACTPPGHRRRTQDVRTPGPRTSPRPPAWPGDASAGTPRACRRRTARQVPGPRADATRPCAPRHAVLERSAGREPPSVGRRRAVAGAATSAPAWARAAGRVRDPLGDHRLLPLGRDLLTPLGRFLRECVRSTPVSGHPPCTPAPSGRTGPVTDRRRAAADGAAEPEGGSGRPVRRSSLGGIGRGPARAPRSSLRTGGQRTPHSSHRSHEPFTRWGLDELEDRFAPSPHGSWRHQPGIFEGHDRPDGKSLASCSLQR